MEALNPNLLANQENASRPQLISKKQISSSGSQALQGLLPQKPSCGRLAMHPENVMAQSGQSATKKPELGPEKSPAGQESDAPLEDVMPPKPTEKFPTNSLMGYTLPKPLTEDMLDRAARWWEFIPFDLGFSRRQEEIMAQVKRIDLPAFDPAPPFAVSFDLNDLPEPKIRADDE